MTDFPIETDEPLPSSGGLNGKTPTRQALEKLLTAESGASIFFPTPPGVEFSRHAQNISSKARAAGGSGWFVTRRQGDGLRVWRL